MIKYNEGKNEYSNFILTEDTFDSRYLGKTESIMAQGNGYMCVRGYSEENYMHKTANTFIAGTFNKANENEVTELPNASDCFSLEIKLNKITFFLTEENVDDYKKTLNMKTGELIRTFVFNTSDNSYKFTYKRFVSADDLHLSASTVEIKPLKASAEIEIISGIDNRVSNSGESHFDEVKVQFLDMKHIFSHMKTTESLIDFYIYSTHRFYVDNKESNILPKPSMNRRQIFQSFKADVKANQSIKLEKYNLYYTSNDNSEIIDTTIDNAKEKIEKVSTIGYETLLENSINKLNEKLWNTQTITIDSEDEFDQLAINYAMYHMFVMTPFHDERMNIGAKGLTGEGYKGHTFWDTEVFILPRFITQDPKVAKKLLKYRYHGLEGARKKAKESGFKGAMFPWEAANPNDGEVTPIYNIMDPMTGERDIVKTGFMEIHITADVSFGVYSYFNFTNDIEFMENYGYEIILDTAIFWSSRLEHNVEKDSYHITGVIGPDEFSEDVDDNAYTNYLAKWNMEYAIEIYNSIKDTELFKAINEKIGFEAELKAIEEKIQKIFIPVADEEGIIDQDTTFRNLEEIDLSKYKNSSKVGEILVDYNLEQISSFKVSKQADIMVLFLLFGEKWNNIIKEKNFNYYEPFCLHDSSLSYSTYSVLANDIGNTTYSYELFKKAARIDLGQEMDACDAGVHAASYGGIWQCIVFGFAGLRMIDRKLNFNPKLPKEINNINFKMYYLNNQLEISINKENITVLNHGEAFDLIINNETVKVEKKVEIKYV